MVNTQYHNPFSRYLISSSYIIPASKLLYQSLIRACDIAYQVMSLAAEPNGLSWKPKIHILEGTQFLRAVLTFISMQVCRQVYPNTHIHTVFHSKWHRQGQLWWCGPIIPLRRQKQEDLTSSFKNKNLCSNFSPKAERKAQILRSTSVRNYMVENHISICN